MPRDRSIRARSNVANAERPVVMTGSQVWHCRGADALAAFATNQGVPVYLNGSARGMLPPGHPNLFNRSRREALAKADVILVLGTPFDPDVHEALAMEESAEHEDNTVMGELEVGYKMGDRVIRPARVRVSKRPIPTPEEPSTE